MTKVIKKKGFSSEQKQLAAQPETEIDNGTEEKGTYVEVEFNEDAGTASVDLENGMRITLSEPRSFDFIEFSSRMETAQPHEKSNVMGLFWLSYLMLSSVVDTKGRKIESHSFEDFKGWLGDTDFVRVKGAFDCFPDVNTRMEQIVKSLFPSS